MTVDARRVTVTTAATRLSGDPTDRTTGSSIAVQAPSGADLFVGGPGVTAATGFPVAAGTKVTFDLQHRDVLYGVLASGTGSAAVLEGGL